MKVITGCSIILLLIFIVMIFSTRNKIKIVFFGDSITEQGIHAGGYINLIQKALPGSGETNKYNLVGAGVGGNKVDDLYRRMEKDVLNENPAIVVVYVGINDVWKKTIGNGTTVEIFEQLYTTIINALQEKNIRVAVCTPSLIGEKRNYANAQDADLEAYSAIVRKLAASFHCTLIDLRKAFMNVEAQDNPGDKEYGILTTDGVHLNDRGNRLVAEEVMKALFNK